MSNKQAGPGDDPKTEFSSGPWRQLSEAMSQLSQAVTSAVQALPILFAGTGTILKAGEKDVMTSWATQALGTSGYAHDPEPPCGKYGTVCQDLVVTLPDVTTVLNTETTVIAIRYYLSDCGSNPPPQVTIPAGQNGYEQPWCKVYAATQAWEQLPQLRRQLVIKAQVRNWSSAYPCYARLEVDWKYTDPGNPSKAATV